MKEILYILEHFIYVTFYLLFVPSFFLIINTVTFIFYLEDILYFT
jgi:hypothetical protein